MSTLIMLSKIIIHLRDQLRFLGISRGCHNYPIRIPPEMVIDCPVIPSDSVAPK
jgi:hypothetical protein